VAPLPAGRVGGHTKKAFGTHVAACLPVWTTTSDARTSSLLMFCRAHPKRQIGYGQRMRRSILATNSAASSRSKHRRPARPTRLASPSGRSVFPQWCKSAGPPAQAVGRRAGQCDSVLYLSASITHGLRALWPSPIRGRNAILAPQHNLQILWYIAGGRLAKFLANPV
jgi:hypothetical protein